jgi:hypothetical protein
MLPPGCKPASFNSSLVDCFRPIVVCHLIESLGEGFDTLGQETKIVLCGWTFNCPEGFTSEIFSKNLSRRDEAASAHLDNRFHASLCG